MKRRTYAQGGMMPYFTKLHLPLDAKKQLDAELREYIAKRG